MDRSPIALFSVPSTLCPPVVAEIIRAGGNAASFEADVSLDINAKGLIDFAVSEFGRIDVLVNNAGLAAGRPLIEIDADHVNTQTALNIAGVLFASKHATIAFGDAGGSIINISSHDRHSGRERTLVLHQIFT
ncbi:MAG: SDR family oxidoreductase [Acidiphilium sp.]|nr:SDR family oxidoreductase [Acidiphilium sp.]MDD4936451.1 SDR family oxidoreductase [Acidiphilium sp.]